MTYKPYRGKRIYKRTVADILSDPYTAIQALMVVIYVMAISLIIMAGIVINLSKLPIPQVITPVPKTSVISEVTPADIMIEEVEVEIIESKDFITAKKEGYRDKGFYKEYFEWLLYIKYIKKSC